MVCSRTGSKQSDWAGQELDIGVRSCSVGSHQGTASGDVVELEVDGELLVALNWNCVMPEPLADGRAGKGQHSGRVSSNKDGMFQH